MGLVSTIELMKKAKSTGYGVAACNVYNLESCRAVIKAAEEVNAPVIVQVWSGTFQFGTATPWTLGALIRAEAEYSSVPVAVHLDHGETEAEILGAIRGGFKSVMIDASTLPLKENIELTKRITMISHPLAVDVEAELGHVPTEMGGDDKPEIFLTDPEEAVLFVKETGIDALAVSIGTVHGKYRAKPVLDFDRIRGIAGRVDIPLVMHGSSYVSDDDLSLAVKAGLTKVNIATELSNEFLDGMKDALKGNPMFPNDIIDAGMNKMIPMVKHKLEVLGSAGKAGKV